LETTYDELLEVFGKCYSNQFPISIDGIIDHRLAMGLYLESSVFGHSCLANAWASFVGIRQQIRAIKHINPGAPVYLLYIKPVTPTEQRRMKLKSEYFFDCSCALCTGSSLASRFQELLDAVQQNKTMDSWPVRKQMEHILDQAQIIELIFGRYSPVLYECLWKLFELVEKLDLHHLREDDRFREQVRAAYDKLVRVAQVLFGEEHPSYRLLMSLVAEESQKDSTTNP
jgi:hypothetical protein